MGILCPVTSGSQDRKGHFSQSPGFMPCPMGESWAPWAVGGCPTHHRHTLATLEVSAADSAEGSAAIQAECQNRFCFLGVCDSGPLILALGSD